MNYWQVKAAAAVRQLRLEQLKAEYARVDAEYRVVMEANGLDAAKNYRLVDADESVTEEPPKEP